MEKGWNARLSWKVNGGSPVLPSFSLIATFRYLCKAVIELSGMAKSGSSGTRDWADTPISLATMTAVFIRSNGFSCAALGVLTLVWLPGHAFNEL